MRHTVRNATVFVRSGLIPGPIKVVNCADRLLDLGSVSTGYSVRPVAWAIKIKHAGLNLAGPLWVKEKEALGLFFGICLQAQ